MALMLRNSPQETQDHIWRCQWALNIEWCHYYMVFLSTILTIITPKHAWRAKYVISIVISESMFDFSYCIVIFNIILCGTILKYALTVQCCSVITWAFFCNILIMGTLSWASHGMYFVILNSMFPIPHLWDKSVAYSTLTIVIPYSTLNTCLDQFMILKSIFLQYFL